MGIPQHLSVCYYNNTLVAVGIPPAENALIWKALDTLQNQTAFYMVRHSFNAYGGSYTPVILYMYMYTCNIERSV